VVTDPFGGGGEAEVAKGPELPTLTPAPEKPGNSFAEGVDSLSALLREMKNARDTGLPDKPVEQPWKMLLLEGTEPKELEFSSDSKLPQLAGGNPAPTGDKPSTVFGPGLSREKEPAADKPEEDGFSRLPPVELEVPNDGS
jgi:hypothetical protein